jgi:hypothetical protein
MDEPKRVFERERSWKIASDSFGYPEVAVLERTLEKPRTGGRAKSRTYVRTTKKSLCTEG